MKYRSMVQDFKGAAVKWDRMLIDSQGCLEWARGRQDEWERNPALSPTRVFILIPNCGCTQTSTLGT
jgi:hypothetical protein